MFFYFLFFLSFFHPLLKRGVWMILNCEKSEGRCWEEVKNNLTKILENGVIQEFLEDEENNELFNQLLENPDEEQLRFLDEKFKEFYRMNRIIRYLSGLIRRYPIDYDKRMKLRNSRFLLIIDKTVTNNMDESNVGMIDLIKDDYQKELDENLLKPTGFFSIENDELELVINELNKKQKQILYLYYERGLNNKEIGDLFGQTEQNISYWHKKTLKHLAERISSK